MNHIDRQIKAKFEDFAPAPPGHIWKGVEKGIISKPGFFALYGKQIAAAILLAGLVLLGVWFFSTRSSGTPDGTQHIVDSVPAVSSDTPATTHEVTETEDPVMINRETELPEKSSDIDPVNEMSISVAENSRLETENSTDVPEVTDKATAKFNDIPTPLNTSPERNNTIGSAFATDIVTLPSLSLSLNNPMPHEDFAYRGNYIESPALPKLKPNKYRSWSTGIYFTPEMYFEKFDSLTTLPSYTLSIEPTCYINKHFFLRFGLGFTYGHDRGYTRISYSEKNLLGTYEDVYDVTFDSVNGQLVATYYTKTTEVWDTTDQVTVSEPTNTYYYLQTPLMLGYYNRTKHITWYFYGGPSFSYMISRNIEKPLDKVDYVELFEVANHLPARSDYYFQLWLGAGIELKVSNNFSLALEPNYRMTLNDLYQNQSYKKALSGFAVRFGFVYYFK